MGKAQQEQARKNDRLFQASREGKADAVKQALEDGAEVNHAGGVFGESSLHVACAQGKLDIVKILCEAGADVNVKCERENTPLHEAAFSGHMKIVKHLVEKTKAKVRVRNAQNISAARLARRQRHKDILLYLEKAWDARAGDRESARRARAEREASPAPAGDGEEGGDDSAAAAADMDLAKRVGAWWLGNIHVDPATPPTWDDVRAHVDFLSSILKPLKDACGDEKMYGQCAPEQLFPLLVPGLKPDQCKKQIPRRRAVAGEEEPEPEPEPEVEPTEPGSPVPTEPVPAMAAAAAAAEAPPAAEAPAAAGADDAAAAQKKAEEETAAAEEETAAEAEAAAKKKAEEEAAAAAAAAAAEAAKKKADEEAAAAAAAAAAKKEEPAPAPPAPAPAAAAVPAAPAEDIDPDAECEECFMPMPDCVCNL